MFNNKIVHLIGIGGISMSSIALMLLNENVKVTLRFQIVDEKRTHIKQEKQSQEVNLKEKSFNSSFNSNENSILNKNKSIYISDYLNNSLLSNYTIYTTKKRKYRRNEKRKKNIDIKETTFLIRLNQ